MMCRKKTNVLIKLETFLSLLLLLDVSSIARADTTPNPNHNEHAAMFCSSRSSDAAIKNASFKLHAVGRANFTAKQQQQQPTGGDGGDRPAAMSLVVTIGFEIGTEVICIKTYEFNQTETIETFAVEVPLPGDVGWPMLVDVCWKDDTISYTKNTPANQQLPTRPGMVDILQPPGTFSTSNSSSSNNAINQDLSGRCNPDPLVVVVVPEHNGILFAAYVEAVCDGREKPAQPQPRVVMQSNDGHIGWPWKLDKKVGHRLRRSAVAGSSQKTGNGGESEQNLANGGSSSSQDQDQGYENWSDDTDGTMSMEEEQELEKLENAPGDDWKAAAGMKPTGTKRRWAKSGMAWIKRTHPESRWNDDESAKEEDEAAAADQLEKRRWEKAGMSWIKKWADGELQGDDYPLAADKRRWEKSGMGWIKRRGSDRQSPSAAAENDALENAAAANANPAVKRRWEKSGMSWIKRSAA